MTRSLINIEDFVFKPMANWNGQGMLLTSGDWQAGIYNAMTVGWGSLFMFVIYILNLSALYLQQE